MKMTIAMFKNAAAAIRKHPELETSFQMVDTWSNVTGAPHVSRNGIPYIRDLKTRKLWKVQRFEIIYGYGPWKQLQEGKYDGDQIQDEG